jgi:predicted phosphodiesterase
MLSRPGHASVAPSRPRPPALARGATRFLFLGDLLGRGDSERVVALARQWADLVVVGNRDLDWQGRVAPAIRAYVLGLPRLVAGDDFLAVHGDDRLTPGLGSGEVRRGFPRAYARLRERGKRLLFLGHTHHARIWRKDGPDAAPTPLDGRRVTLDADPAAVWIVNVGSVGLPFPGKGPASFVLYLYDAAGGWIATEPVPP